MTLTNYGTFFIFYSSFIKYSIHYLLYNKYTNLERHRTVHPCNHKFSV